jgi:hypothetical protein
VLGERGHKLPIIMYADHVFDNFGLLASQRSSTTARLGAEVQRNARGVGLPHWARQMKKLPTLEQAGVSDGRGIRKLIS